MPALPIGSELSPYTPTKPGSTTPLLSKSSDAWPSSRLWPSSCDHAALFAVRTHATQPMPIGQPMYAMPDQPQLPPPASSGSSIRWKSNSLASGTCASAVCAQPVKLHTAMNVEKLVATDRNADLLSSNTSAPPLLSLNCARTESASVNMRRHTHISLQLGGTGSPALS